MFYQGLSTNFCCGPAGHELNTGMFKSSFCLSTVICDLWAFVVEGNCNVVMLMALAPPLELRLHLFVFALHFTCLRTDGLTTARQRPTFELQERLPLSAEVTCRSQWAVLSPSALTASLPFSCASRVLSLSLSRSCFNWPPF